MNVLNLIYDIDAGQFVESTTSCVTKPLQPFVNGELKNISLTLVTAAAISKSINNPYDIFFDPSGVFDVQIGNISSTGVVTNYTGSTFYPNIASSSYDGILFISSSAFANLFTTSPIIEAELQCTLIATSSIDSYIQNYTLPIIQKLSGGSFYPIYTPITLITSASFSLTASYALNGGGGPSISASYAGTASVLLGSSENALISISSSFASSSISSSFAVSASYAPTLVITNVEFSTQSLFATQSSFSTQSLFATQSTYASTSLVATSASFATSASYVISASAANVFVASIITASSGLVIGPGSDNAGVTLYVSASNRGNNHIVEVDNLNGNEVFSISATGSLSIGTDVLNSTAPEMLKIYGVLNPTYNLIGAYGNINNYCQMNITNSNVGSASSADYVATADYGSENWGYLNMGIGSLGHNDPRWTWVTSGSAYIYTIGSGSYGGNLYISAVSTQSSIVFGVGPLATERLRITSSYISASVTLIAPTIATNAYQLTQSYYYDRSNPTYTIASADNGKLIIFTGSVNQTVTLTTSNVDAGWSAMFFQSGSGRIYFTTASTSVFMRNRSGFTGSAGQYATVTVYRVPSGDFILGGDMT